MELRFLLWIVVGIWKLVAYVITGIVKAIAWALGKLEGLGDEALRKRRESGRAQTGAAGQRPAPATLRTAARPRLSPTDVTALRIRTDEITGNARAVLTQAAERDSTQRFTATLDALIERVATIALLARRGDGTRSSMERELAREETLVQIVSVMVSERRSPSLAPLLADTDALAIASYAPIVEYCTNRRIPLSSDRAGTIVGGDKLFFCSVDDPTGLAAIVVPDSFRTEIITWPAIAHEIAHDFFRSVTGLGAELRRALRLGTDLTVPAFTGDRAALDKALALVPARATAAWCEELFADGFGTLMLGPAYVETMAASFASPDDPARTVIMGAEADGGPPRYEEHPPGHVRVVVACRLLGKMGYGKVGNELENRWRQRHKQPSSLYVPLIDGRYALVPEGPTIDHAALVGETLYMQGLPCLRGQPLRSIPGLDFGPREHMQAQRVADKLAALQPASPGDPRLLVAGAVLATVARPDRARMIYALARAAIEGLAGDRGDAASTLQGNGLSGPIDGNAFREAFIAGELLGTPKSRRSTARR